MMGEPTVTAREARFVIYALSEEGVTLSLDDQGGLQCEGKPERIRPWQAELERCETRILAILKDERATEAARTHGLKASRVSYRRALISALRKPKEPW